MCDGEFYEVVLASDYDKLALQSEGRWTSLQEREKQINKLKDELAAAEKELRIRDTDAQRDGQRRAEYWREVDGERAKLVKERDAALSELHKAVQDSRDLSDALQAERERADKATAWLEMIARERDQARVEVERLKEQIGREDLVRGMLVSSNAERDKYKAALEQVVSEGIDTSTDGGVRFVRNALEGSGNKTEPHAMINTLEGK